MDAWTPTRVADAGRWLTARLTGRLVPVEAVRDDAERQRLAWEDVVTASRMMAVAERTVGVERGSIRCWQLPEPPLH